MVLNQHALSQCILRRDHPTDPLDVYIHNGLIMGHISSSSLAGFCMIQTGKVFDDLLDKARAQTLDYDKIYAPLSYALREGILKPSSLPKSFSLEKLIRDSLYADNLIICKDSSSDLVKEAVSLILSLNGYSFKVHELFSNTIPELSLIKTIVDDYGGHVKLHPEILRIMEDSKDPNEIRDNVEAINNVQDLPSDKKSEVIPEEDQNGEVPSSCSDELPQERNGDLKSQPNL